MASDDADPQDLKDATHEPRECMACRGTGRVISNLGGTPSTVECPWCGGSALRLTEVDAQARWMQEREAAGEDGAAQPSSAIEPAGDGGADGLAAQPGSADEAPAAPTE